MTTPRSPRTRSGLQLFEAGDAEARAHVPHYDTGAWSLYDQFGESDLNYHELLTEFLQHLCERTRNGPPLRRPRRRRAARAATTPTTTHARRGDRHAPAARRPSGAAAAPAPRGHRPHDAAASHPEHADRRRSDLLHDRQRFTADLHTPPAISLLTTTLPGGTRAGVQVSLSKISTVHLTVRHGGTVVWTNSATVERGKPRLLWLTPRKGGTFAVTLTATDLAGNFATAERHDRRVKPSALAPPAPPLPRLGAQVTDSDDEPAAGGDLDAAHDTAAHAWRALTPEQRLAAPPRRAVRLDVPALVPAEHGRQRTRDGPAAEPPQRLPGLLVRRGGRAARRRAVHLRCCSRAPRDATSSSPAATARS